MSDDICYRTCGASKAKDSNDWSFAYEAIKEISGEISEIANDLYCSTCQIVKLAKINHDLSILLFDMIERADEGEYCLERDN